MRGHVAHRQTQAATAAVHEQSSRLEHGVPPQGIEVVKRHEIHEQPVQMQIVQHQAFDFGYVVGGGGGHHVAGGRLGEELGGVSLEQFVHPLRAQVVDGRSRRRDNVGTGHGVGFTGQGGGIGFKEFLQRPANPRGSWRPAWAAAVS